MLPEDVLIFCQVFGAFPFRYRTSHSGKKVIEYTPIVFLWGIAIIMFQIGLSMCAILLDYAAKDKGTLRMTSPTSIIVVCLDIGTLNLMGVVNTVTSVRKQEVFIKICNILEGVDNMMKRVVNTPKGRLKAIAIFVAMVCFLFVSTQIDKMHWENQKRKHPSVYSPVYTTYCVHLVLFTHYTYVTNNISRRFKMVNERMKHLLIKITLCQGRANWIFNVEAPSGYASVMSEIKTLMEVYWLLCDAVKQANTFYSSQLLVAIFTSFVHLIITWYYLFINALPTLDPDSLPYLGMLFVWAQFHTVQLFWLVWPSTDVTEAAEQTSQVICRYVNKNVPPDIEKLLDVFLLQLRHQHVKFSALGLFPIHRHILTSIAGSVTTYLVILIQFHLSQQGKSSPKFNNAT